MKTVTLVLALLFSCSTMMPGCTNNPPGVPSTEPQPLILQAITGGMEFGTAQGLQALAKSNPAAADTTAAALKKAVETVLLPYFNGGKIGTAAEIQELLNTSLFAGIDPAVREAIANAAAMVFDAYVPVPGATTFLTSTQIAYFKAFLTGISKGCDDFHSKAIPAKHWLDAK